MYPKNRKQPYQQSAMFIVVIAFALLCAYCTTHTDKQTNMQVFVSIPPQAYFVEQIGGSHIDVQVLIAPGYSPATYEPTSQIMTRLARANLFFRIGLPFEDRLLEKISSEFKQLKIVDTREDIKLQPAYQHQVKKQHQEGRLDPHIWLDPNLVKIQAETICAALSELDQAHAAEYRSNLSDFQCRLDSTDSVIRELLTPLRGKAFWAFHPAFGYFAHAYGLKQKAIEIEGKEPSARQLVELVEQARQEKVRALFVQKQFSKKEAQTIAKAIDAKVVELDPLARDYLNNLHDIAVKTAAALGDGYGAK